MRGVRSRCLLLLLLLSYVPTLAYVAAQPPPMSVLGVGRAAVGTRVLPPASVGGRRDWPVAAAVVVYLRAADKRYTDYNRPPPPPPPPLL